MGVNTALRISDVLRLRISDFVDEQQHVRRRFWIREQKRGKRHEVVVNDSIRSAFTEYLTAYPNVARVPEHFVFFNTKTHDYTQPIKRGQAWKFMTAICREVGNVRDPPRPSRPSAHIKAAMNGRTPKGGWPISWLDERASMF